MQSAALALTTKYTTTTMRKYSTEHKENNSIQWRIQDFQMGARSSAAGARIEAPKEPRG